MTVQAIARRPEPVAAASYGLLHLLGGRGILSERGRGNERGEDDGERAGHGEPSLGTADDVG
jgi:hypothetical protein